MPELAGWLVRRLLLARRLLPGVAGAAAVAVGAGEITGHLAGRGLTWWVALALGGAFLLLLDRRL